MKARALIIACLLACASPAFAGAVPFQLQDATIATRRATVNANGAVGVVLETADPCQNPDVLKSSIAVDITSATTTEIVAGVAAKKVYVCGWDSIASGTSPTFTFKTGTKTTTPCDTTAATLSGAYAPPNASTGMFASAGGDYTKMVSITAGEICITSGGTPVMHGTLYYVQQ